MTFDARPKWWPGKKLGRHPIQNVLVCGHRLHPPMFSHIVNFPRLETPLRGCYENQIEAGGGKVTVRLKPGAALFAPPNCWNFPAWEHNMELLSLLFGVKQIGISVVTVRNTGKPRITSQKISLPRPLTGPLPHIVDAMLEAHPAQDAQNVLPELARALIRCVENMLKAPAAATDAGRTQSLFENLCIYLQNNYQYDISRDSVARQFNISPTHLSRIFQTRGHMTFSSYLTHVRIDRAKHLLQSYDFKLDEIAARCGYHYATYFCQIFKQMTKMTPAEYRAKIQLKRAQMPRT
jgi:AraC-like DNA-binding protein